MKRIRLTEGQLHRLIEQALNEDIDYGGLVYGSDTIQVNSEEDLDNLLRQWTMNGDFRSWEDAIMPKIKMGDWIVPVKCGDHGGELYDWAVIEYFHSFYPDNIHTEKGQYGTEYGFVWGSESFLNSNIESATDDFLVNLRCSAANEKIKEVEEEYGIKLDEYAYEDVFDFFYESVCPNNTFDYRESDLEDLLREKGYLQGEANESLSRRVTESIIRRLRRLS